MRKNYLKNFFLINSLGKGGAERVLVDFTNFLIKQDKNRKVTIITTDCEKDVFFPNSYISRKKISFFKNSRYQKLNKIFLPFILIRLALILYQQKESYNFISFLTRSNILNVFCSLIIKNHKSYIFERSIFSQIYLDKNIYQKIIRGFTIIIYKKANLVFVLSKDAKKDLYHLGIDKNKIMVIPNPVNFDFFYKSRLYPSNKEMKLITCSRLIKEKNVDILINLILDLKKKYKNRFVISFDIIGDGEEYETLLKLTNDLDLNKEINFRGWVSHPSNYLNKSNIFLYASKFEGFGNVVLEAMAAGLPIVAYNSIGGIQDILDRGKYGIVVNKPESKEFLNAVSLLFNDKKIYEEYSKKAFKRANLYSQENIFPNLINKMLVKK